MATKAARSFGKQDPPVTEAGVEEGTTNALVHADAFGHLFDVAAAGVADCGHRIDVGDLEGEERVCSVLDKFRAVDVSDKHRRDEGFVELLHEGQGAITVDADHDAIGIHEIVHCATLRAGIQGLLTTSNSAPSPA